MPSKVVCSLVSNQASSTRIFFPAYFAYIFLVAVKPTAIILVYAQIDQEACGMVGSTYKCKDLLIVTIHSKTSF